MRACSACSPYMQAVPTPTLSHRPCHLPRGCHGVVPACTPAPPEADAAAPTAARFARLFTAPRIGASARPLGHGAALVGAGGGVGGDDHNNVACVCKDRVRLRVRVRVRVEVKVACMVWAGRRNVGACSTSGQRGRDASWHREQAPVKKAATPFCSLTWGHGKDAPQQVFVHIHTTVHLPPPPPHRLPAPNSA